MISVDVVMSRGPGSVMACLQMRFRSSAGSYSRRVLLLCSVDGCMASCVGCSDVRTEGAQIFTTNGVFGFSPLVQPCCQNRSLQSLVKPKMPSFRESRFASGPNVIEIQNICIEHYDLYGLNGV